MNWRAAAANDDLATARKRIRRLERVNRELVSALELLMHEWTYKSIKKAQAALALAKEAQHG